MKTPNRDSEFAVTGDVPSDFSRIYALCWKELCSIAARITRDKAVAQDLVQEVFLSYLKNNPQHIENVQAYLVQALKYQCFNWLRHARVAEEHLIRMKKALAENTTEEQVDLMFTADRVRDIVTEMPDRCREVFELSRFRQLSNEEIAAKLNINQRTVENHLTRALKILRFSLRFFALLIVSSLS